jgi:hypothetical protein
MVEAIICGGDLKPWRARIHPPGRPGDFKLVELESLRFVTIANVSDVTIADRAGGVTDEWCWWIANEASYATGVVGPFRSQRLALEDIVLWEKEHRRHVHVSELVEQRADREQPLPLDNVRRRAFPSNRHLSVRVAAIDERRFFELDLIPRGEGEPDDRKVRLRIVLIGAESHRYDRNLYPSHSLLVEQRDNDATGNTSWHPVRDHDVYGAAIYCLVRALATHTNRTGYLGKAIEGDLGFNGPAFTFEPAPVQ